MACQRPRLRGHVAEVVYLFLGGLWLTVGCCSGVFLETVSGTGCVAVFLRGVAATTVDGFVTVFSFVCASLTIDLESSSGCSYCVARPERLTDSRAVTGM